MVVMIIQPNLSKKSLKQMNQKNKILNNGISNKINSILSKIVLKKKELQILQILRVMKLEEKQVLPKKS